jgi:TonB-linked SusC/RagA family outer membrane protein
MPFSLRRLSCSLGLWLLAAAPLAAQQATVTITGRVETDEKVPIPGAVVQVVGIPFSTITRGDGRYTLTIPATRLTPGSTINLTARAISYKPRTGALVVDGNQLGLDFTLPPNPLQLNEIVVTGAGTESEVAKLGNVRNNVDSTAIQRSNETNIVSALAAKAPNVEVTSTSGDPGASSSIRIRGINTLSGAGDPLFVIDGIPVDNSTFSTADLDPFQTAQGGSSAPNRASDINPADIESIEILKGASAGAVYGARAGQGVVLITTKRGHQGQGVSYSLHSSAGFNQVTKTPALQRKFGQGEAGLSDACATADVTADPSFLDCSASRYSWGPALAPGTKTYDHSKELFQDGFTTDNTLTISGGGERTTFYLSAGLSHQVGTIKGPNNRYNKQSFRLKGDQRINDRLTIGANVAYTSAQGDFVQKGSNFSGVGVGSWRTPPEFNNQPYLDPLSGLHRSYRFPHPSVLSGGQSRGYDNPYFIANRAVSTTDADRIIGGITLNYVATSWLRFNYSLGIDYSGDNRLQGLPQTSSNGPDPLGQVIKANLTRTQIDHNLTATASFKLSQKAGGTVTLGQNLNSRNFRQLGVIGNALTAPQPFTLGNTASQDAPSDVENKLRIEGYFGQGTLDLFDQLYLKAGLRYDGSSTFGQANRRNWFPSAQASWLFTNATGTPGNVITIGKARLAYGQAGKEPDPYLTTSTFVAGGKFTDPYSVNENASQRGVGGLFSSTVRPATGLKPERTREIEAGLDLGLFGDHADLSFTWYHRKTNDVILFTPLPPSTGYTVEASNGATIRNAGTELVLNVRPIVTRDFNWEVGFNFGTNRSRVLALRGVDPVDGHINYGGNGGFGTAYTQINKPLGIFRDYDFVRCGRGITDINGVAFDVDASCSAQGIKNHALYIDDGTFSTTGLPGFPVPDYSTTRVMGDPNPKWTGGLRNTFRWKKFTLSSLLDIRHGGQVYNGTRYALINFGTGKDTELRGRTVTFGKDYFRGYKVDGPGAGTAATLSEDFFRYDYGFAVGTGFYEDGSFVKLREITLGYTLDGDFIRQTLGFSSVDVRVSGRNLHTWTNYTGVDPETNLVGAETGARGIDWFNNPQSRSFLFSLTLNR